MNKDDHDHQARSVGHTRIQLPTKKAVGFLTGKQVYQMSCESTLFLLGTDYRYWQHTPTTGRRPIQLRWLTPAESSRPKLFGGLIHIFFPSNKKHVVWLASIVFIGVEATQFFFPTLELSSTLRCRIGSFCSMLMGQLSTQYLKLHIHMLHALAYTFVEYLST